MLLAVSLKLLSISYCAAFKRHKKNCTVLAPGLPAQNGHVVRREDSRGSLLMDPGTPDSIEVRTFDTSRPARIL